MYPNEELVSCNSYPLLTEKIEVYRNLKIPLSNYILSLEFFILQAFYGKLIMKRESLVILQVSFTTQSIQTTQSNVP